MGVEGGGREGHKERKEREERKSPVRDTWKPRENGRQREKGEKLGSRAVPPTWLAPEGW